MKYYTPSHYTGKTKRKRVLRALLIAALLLGILTGTAVLGNLLRDRLTRAEPLLALSAEDYTAETTAPPPARYDKAPAQKPLELRGVCAPLSVPDFSDADTLRHAVQTAAQTAPGVSVTVSDASGLYFALADAAENKTLAAPALLFTAADAAEASGLSLSATVHTTYSLRQDIAVMENLVSCGIREVVLCGLTGSSLTDAQVYDLLLYLEYIRAAAPQMTIGLALSPALFSGAQSAPNLDTLSAYFDFLLLDCTEKETADYAAALRTMLPTLYGSIPYYSLAALIDGREATEEVLTLLEKAKIESVRCMH